jgi:uncharacterized protein (DUF1778 family)
VINGLCIAKHDTFLQDAHPRSPAMPASPRKDQPIAMRLAASDVAMIDRAARIRGRSRTEFVRDAAMRAAEEVVLDNHVIRMDAEAFGAFLAVVAEPGKAVPGLVDLFRRRPPWDDETGGKT